MQNKLAKESINPISDSNYTNYFLEKTRRFFEENEIPFNWDYEIGAILKAVEKYSSGKKVLDMGCGVGTLLLALNREGFVPSGIDFDPVQISTAKQIAEKYGGENIDFKVGKIEERVFPDGSFDIVTSKDVAEHLPDKELEKYLLAGHSYLRKGGSLVIFTKPTRFSYLFEKEKIGLLLPFVFLNKEKLENYLNFLDRWIPKIYKKISGKFMFNTWQEPPPGHCNCPDVNLFPNKVTNAGFKIIYYKTWINPRQRYHRLICKLFPYDFIRRNILLVAQK